MKLYPLAAPFSEGTPLIIDERARDVEAAATNPVTDQGVIAKASPIRLPKLIISGSLGQFENHQQPFK